MNESCDSEHARWLEAVLVDGPQAAPPGTLAAIRACPLCGPEFEELARVQASFEGAGAVRREALDAVAERSASEAREDLATTRAVIERHLRPRRLRPWLVLAFAAAAVLVALNFAVREGPPPAPQPEVHLAPQRTAIVAPEGAVARFGTFEWQELWGGPATYRVRVTATVDDTTVELFACTVEGTLLQVGEDVWATWPDRIEWELETLDRSGNVVETDYGTAWLALR